MPFTTNYQFVKGIYRYSGTIRNTENTISLCIYCSCLGTSNLNHKWSERFFDCIQQQLQYKFDWKIPKSFKTFFSICVLQNPVFSELDRLQVDFFNNLPQLASARAELSLEISNIWELSSLKHFKWLSLIVQKQGNQTFLKIRAMLWRVTRAWKY